MAEEPGFFEWFKDRLALSLIDPELKVYRVRHLFKHFLGVHSPGAYQWWEKRAEEMGYPVPEPRRIPLWPHVKESSPTSQARAYSCQEFVDVAYWWWERNVKEELVEERCV